MKIIAAIASAMFCFSSCVQPILESDFFEAEINDIIVKDSSSSQAQTRIHSGDSFVVRVKANKGSFILNEIRVGYSDTDQSQDVKLTWKYNSKEVTKDMKISGNKDSYYEFVCETKADDFLVTKKPIVYITVTDGVTGRRITMKKYFIIYPYLGTSIRVEDCQTKKEANKTKDGGKYILIEGGNYDLVIQTSHKSFGIKDYVGDGFTFDNFGTNGQYMTEKAAQSDLVGTKRFKFTPGSILEDEMSQEKELRFILTNEETSEAEKFTLGFKICARAEFAMAPVTFSEDYQQNPVIFSIHSETRRERLKISALQLTGEPKFVVTAPKDTTGEQIYPFESWFNETQTNGNYIYTAEFHKNNTDGTWYSETRLNIPAVTVYKENEGDMYLTVYDPVTEADYNIKTSYKTLKSTKDIYEPTYFGIKVNNGAMATITDGQTSPTSVDATMYATDEDVIQVSLFAGGKDPNGEDLSPSSLINAGFTVTVPEQYRDIVYISEKKTSVYSNQVVFSNNGEEKNMHQFYIKANKAPTNGKPVILELSTQQRSTGETSGTITAYLNVYITSRVALVVDVDDIKKEIWKNNVLTCACWYNMPIEVNYSICEWGADITEELEKASENREINPEIDDALHIFTAKETYGSIRAKHKMVFDQKSNKSKKFSLWGNNITGMFNRGDSDWGFEREFKTDKTELALTDLSFTGKVDNNYVYTYDMEEEELLFNTQYTGNTWNPGKYPREAYLNWMTDDLLYNISYPVEFWTAWSDYGLYEKDVLFGSEKRTTTTSWKYLSYIIDPESIAVSEDFKHHYKLTYIIYMYKIKKPRNDFYRVCWFNPIDNRLPAVVKVNSVKTYE